MSQPHGASLGVGQPFGIAVLDQVGGQPFSPGFLEPRQNSTGSKLSASR